MLLILFPLLVDIRGSLLTYSFFGYSSHFAVTYDLVTSFSSLHIQYSGQVQWVGHLEVTSLQGSCVTDGISQSPTVAFVNYDGNEGTNDLIVITGTGGGGEDAACTWPPTGMSHKFPATIQNGIAVSSGSIVRPCFEADGRACSDTVSWDIIFPLQPAEVCPHGASESALSAAPPEPVEKNVETQKVANYPVKSLNLIGCVLLMSFILIF
ncbi:MAG: hypothetical protein ACRD8W_27645 [Nitrososphaeraceae archaeon]